MRIKRWIAGVLIALAMASAHASVLVGRVVGVSDGDTITVLDARKRQHKVRLNGIDAPEARQAFGQRAKQALSDYIYWREVRVEYTRRDRYGRIVGKVLVDGDDANLRMLQSGLAWWYRAYARDQSSTDRKLYRAAEQAARKDRIGLWSAAKPVPPWEYRKQASAK